MKEFKDTKYGDLTGETFFGNKFGINVNREGLKSLYGSPKRVENGYYSADMNNITSLKYAPEYVDGSFYCRKNENLLSFEFAPTTINGTFHCDMNFQIKNQKEQIIKYQIKAVEYVTDEGTFNFENIKNEFEIGSRVKSKGFRTLLGLDK